MQLIGNIKNNQQTNPAQYNAMLKKKSGQQPPQPDHLGADIGGMVGGTIGQIAGTPLDLLTGPAGTAGGGALGGSIGGAIGEGAQELASGKGINFGDIASEAGQQGMWSAIPGDPEAHLGLKLLSRFGSGALTDAGAKALQNHQEGKPITDDLLSSMLTAGATNTILPSATEGLSKFLFGDAQKITKDIASVMVGGEHATDPEILQHLDFANPEKSLTALRNYAFDAYKPAADAIAKSNTTLGDFFDAVTNKGRTYLSDMQANDFKNALGMAEDKAGEKTKNMMGYMREMLSGNVPVKVPATYRDLPMSMNVAHEFKKSLNYDLNPELYQNIHSYIDTQVKKQTGVDVHKADAIWNKFLGESNKNGVNIDGAITHLEKLYQKEGQNIKTGHGLDWSQRAQLMAGAALVGHMLGLGGSGAEMIGAPLMLGVGTKALMTSNGQKAKPYITTLSKQPVTKITQQITNRLAPAISQIIQEMMGGKQPDQQQQDQAGDTSMFGQ